VKKEISSDYIIRKFLTYKCSVQTNYGDIRDWFIKDNIFGGSDRKKFKLKIYLSSNGNNVLIAEKVVENDLKGLTVNVDIAHTKKKITGFRYKTDGIKIESKIKSNYDILGGPFSLVHSPNFEAAFTFAK